MSSLDTDSNALKPFLARVASGTPLSEEEAGQAFEIIMSGVATPAQVGAFLMGLKVRGEAVTEIAGAARVMRAKAMAVEAPAGAMDTCGTGGDVSGTFNISTAVSFVLAAAGVPVAKHGNRALTSKAGTADVLAALGVNLDADPRLVRKSLWENGICFMMAPRHHSAMKHVMPVRLELAPTSTIFNLLGPLANPAGAKRQLLGVFHRRWTEPFAETLGRLSSERAWIVHGSDGLDELTLTGPSFVAELKDGRVRSFEVAPEDAGLSRCDPAALKGGDAQANAATMRALLDGARSPIRDIVLLNAAAALVVAEKAADLRSGAAIGAELIDTGAARAKLDQLVAITNSEIA